MAALSNFNAKENYNHNDKNRNHVYENLRQRLAQEFENLELGELVDEQVRNENKRRSQFADCDLITQCIEKITRLAVEEQADQNLKRFLNAESKEFLRSTLIRNKQNKKNAEEHMKNLHLQFIAKYEKKTDEFLEIQPPSVFKHQSILQSFHNKTTQRLLEKYRKLQKPGTIAFKMEYERRLMAAFEEENVSKQKTAIRYEETSMASLIIFAFIFYILFAMILTFGLYYLHTQGGILSETANQELDSEFVINGTRTSIVDGLNNRIQFLESQIRRCDKRRKLVSEIDEKILVTLNEKIGNLTREKINLQAVTDRCNTQIAIKSSRDTDTIMNLNSQIRSLSLEKNLSATHIPHKVSAMFKKHIYQHDITNNTVIGIEIGSKYCHSAVYFAGKVYKIPHYDQSGEVYQSMSTYVGVDKFEAFVGQSAQKKVETLKEFSTVFYDVIHFLQHDGIESVDNETEYINFGFTPNAETTETTRSILLANNQTYFVTDILSKLFRKLRDNASHILNVNVSKCVIAYTGVLSTRDLQKKLIRKGAEMAGFNEITFLHEDYAAGIGLITTRNTWKTPSTIFSVYLDSRYWYFGVFQKLRRTFQMSDFEEFYGTIYDTGYLQNKLINYCLEEFIIAHKNVSLSSLKSDTIENKVRFRRLHESCNKAISSLSTSQTATVHITKFADGLDFVVNFTRAKFEELCENTFSEINKDVNDVLTRATLKIADIDYVILTGDSSRIPKVQEIVTNIFGNKIVDLMGMEPDEVVAFGAAIYGAILGKV